MINWTTTMRTYICLLLLLTSSAPAFSQSTADSTWLDFWVGHWELSWEDGDGQTGLGENVIERILDGKVIQENFKATSGKLQGFFGKSMSVFNPRNQTWRQAWTDNQGSYFSFLGATEGNKKVFKTTPCDDGLIQRMVFYNITSNSLTWDWESSTDGGKNWTLQWRIYYKRVK